jgi:SAM-dependent methyltransferase
MTNAKDYKWLIPSARPASQSSEQEKGLWNQLHTNYADKVFSLTQDPEICKALIRPSNQSPCFDIPDSPEIKVLIPGCGSEIYLQKTLLEFCPNIGQVCSTDFSQTGIDVAQQKWQQADGDARLNNQQLIFAEADSTKLTEQRPDWKDKFDYVLVVNSVLSAEDEINRQMIGEFCKVLKPGGKLYGFFSSIFWDLEVAYLTKSHAHWLTDGSVNFPQSAAYINGSNQRQTFYTPLRLNRIFKEAGFHRLSFELDFFDSDILSAKLQEGEKLDDPDIYSWEFLVRYEKQKV